MTFHWYDLLTLALAGLLLAPWAFVLMVQLWQILVNWDF